MFVQQKTIFVNGVIKTMDLNNPEVEAVCVSAGKIEALGKKSEILEYVKNVPHEMIDLQGKVAYPGFIDTHSHLDMCALALERVSCDLSLKTIDTVINKLKEKAHATPKGEWVVGYCYDDTGLQDNRHLDKHDLDKVSTEHPVIVFHISTHLGYINSYAIKKLGITKNNKVEGGEYVIGEDGEPTGLLLEFAFFETIAYLPEPTEERLKELIEQAVHNYNAVGITTFHVGGIGLSANPEKTMRCFLDLERQGKLTGRAYLHFMPGVMETFAQYGLWNFGSDYLKFGGLKYFTDGSIQAFTAALSEDYYSKPGYKGSVLFPQEEIDAIIEKYHLMGVQVAVHTNGDQASKGVIQAFEKAYEKSPVRLNHLLIHAQTVREDQLDRMKAIGIIPSFFGQHISVWGDRHASIFLGPERTGRMNPAGSAVRRDMPFSLHSDSPVLPIMVLESINTAVNRKSSGGKIYGEDQKITPYQALQAYTTHAALCCLSENDRGALKAGYYADMVVLERDIEKIAPETIIDTKICMTVCGGKIVYKA